MVIIPTTIIIAKKISCVRPRNDLIITGTPLIKVIPPAMHRIVLIIEDIFNKSSLSLFSSSVIFFTFNFEFLRKLYS